MIKAALQLNEKDIILDDLTKLILDNKGKTGFRLKMWCFNVKHNPLKLQP